MTQYYQKMLLSLGRKWFLDTGHEKRIFPHGRSESFFQFQVPGPRSNNTLELEYIGIY